MNKEEFLSFAEGYYKELESLKEAPTFYDYEKDLEAIMRKMSCEYMEKQLGEGSVTENRRKKKR
ncbi:MAG: hypothetical protein LBC80_08775 [Treponema sp.]|jgi:hypothetical protein|nr:hypothetical protein [Treponema sp.]